MLKNYAKITIKSSLEVDGSNNTDKGVLEKLLNSFEYYKNGEEYICTLNLSYDAVFGMGEKFDRVNQRGHTVLTSVIEKCFDQCEYTYCPIPLAYTRHGYGVFVDNYAPVKFDFTRNGKFCFSFIPDKGRFPEFYFLLGNPAEILNAFTHLTGRSKLFPKWVFGAWMSSNRWHTQDEIDEQLAFYDASGLPMNTMVIEPWSDETTYYIWNGAKYDLKKGDEAFKYSDFDFTENKFWHDPKKMIDDIHSRGIRVLLWELPVYAALNLCKGDIRQHKIDLDYTENNKLCVMRSDNEPYNILPGNWYAGSCIPDFTNEETVKNWFAKKQYLLDMGIDGFKTDGGEFIYKDDLIFANGLTGKEMKNGYCRSYVQAYNAFVGDKRIIYSRAGYLSQQSFTTHWAGDQESKWSEFRAVIKAGLSASLSGIAVYGYDLAGFAGFMPSKELYLRATQAAAFSPIMQWHSEPAGNGPCDPEGKHKINDRSPWNMAEFYKDADIIERLRYHYNLRTNLIPYLYNLSVIANETGAPIMKHMIYDYPMDSKCIEQEEQFILGDILVAPILWDHTVKKDVYLPDGIWIDFYSHKKIDGGRLITVDLHPDRTPAFIKENSCIVLNTDFSGRAGTFVGNSLEKYNTLTFIINGTGEYTFKDDLGNIIKIKWDKKTYKFNQKPANLKLKVVRL